MKLLYIAMAHGAVERKNRCATRVQSDGGRAAAFSSSSGSDVKLEYSDI